MPLYAPYCLFLLCLFWRFSLDLSVLAAVFAYVGCRVRVVRAWRDRQSPESFDWAEGVLKYYWPKYRAVFVHFLLSTNKQDICSPADAPPLHLAAHQLPFSPEESHRGWFSLAHDVIRLASSEPVWWRPEVAVPQQLPRDKLQHPRGASCPTQQQQQELLQHADADGGQETQQGDSQYTQQKKAAADSPWQSLPPQEARNSAPTDAGSGDGKNSGQSSSSRAQRCRSCSKPVYYIMTPSQPVEVPPEVDPRELLKSYPSWAEPSSAAKAAVAAAAAAGPAPADAQGEMAATGSSKSNSTSSSNGNANSAAPSSLGDTDTAEAVNLYWGLQCCCCQRVFHTACIRPAHRRIATGGCAWGL